MIDLPSLKTQKKKKKKTQQRVRFLLLRDSHQWRMCDCINRTNFSRKLRPWSIAAVVISFIHRVGKGTVCLKCGDEGFPETLVFCKECQACALHRYCLNGSVVFWEEVIWFCEDCEVKLVKPSSFDICVSASPENSDSISLENDAYKATKKFRNCINRMKKSNQQAHNIIEERKLNKRKISNQLAYKHRQEHNTDEKRTE